MPRDKLLHSADSKLSVTRFLVNRLLSSIVGRMLLVMAKKRRLAAWMSVYRFVVISHSVQMSDRRLYINL